MTAAVLPGLPTLVTVKFFVPGKPAAQGSKRHVGGGRMIESSKEVGPWRERVALAAHMSMVAAGDVHDEIGLLTGPVAVDLLFVLPRPKSAPKRTTPPASKRPDVDKLARAVLDAVTDVIIRDDAQVVDLRARKRVAELDGSMARAGVYVTVSEEIDDV